MKQYHELLNQVFKFGHSRIDRTGTGTSSLFCPTSSVYKMSDGFPMLTTKRVYWKGVVHELLWFISGDTNIKYLQDNDVHIWDEWADENGDLGPVYGAQWAKQLDGIIEEIKTNPTSRRLIVDCWQVNDLNDMALPPCHMLFQFYVRDGELDLMLHQRSADLFLGVPFNIPSYSLLLHMIAQVCGLKPGNFIHNIGDAHIYNNHFDQVAEILSREPSELPTIELDPSITDIHDFTFDSINLLNYDPQPAIKAKVSV